MKRTYFFNLLKMKMLSIRLIISVFCMVFMNFFVVMPDIRANYDTLDIVYLFRFTYDIGSFSRLLPLLAAFVMADAVAQDFCDHTMPFLLARMDDKTSHRQRSVHDYRTLGGYRRLQLSGLEP